MKIISQNTITTNSNFTLVKDKSSLNDFASIWKDICLEENVPFSLDRRTIKFLLRNEESNESVGTLEFSQYIPGVSSIDHSDKFKFFENEKVRELLDKNIYIISKLGIKKEFRRTQRLDSLVDAIIFFAKEEKVDYFISTINPKLLRALRINAGITSIKLGETFEFGQNRATPILVPVATLLQQYNAYIQKQFRGSTKIIK